MIKSTVKPTSTKPSKSSTKPATKSSAKSATPVKPVTPTKQPSTPVKAPEKPITQKPVTKELPKPVESVKPVKPVKPVVNDSSNTVEDTPVKPVKEVTKNIETKVMKEKQETVSAVTKPSTDTIKANGNPGAKTTANATETSKMPDKTTQEKKDVEQVVFAWTPEGAENVQICGSFNDWKEKLDMKNDSGKHQLSIPLKPGKYSYKFIVDGEWYYDFTAPNERDDEGNVNNVITV